MKRYVIKNKARFLVSISIIIIFAVSSLFTMAVSAKDNNEVLLVPEYIEEGDTIWGLSEGYAGEMDIRDYISKVMDVNGLRSASIKPGELVYFPIFK